MRGQARVPTRWGWLAATAARRARSQWRPLAVVATVALVVTTLLGTLTLLVTRTEDQAVQAALTEASAESRTVTVQGTSPSASIADVRARTGAGLATALGVPVEPGPGEALSVLRAVPRPGLNPALLWMASFDDLTDHATLVDGEWPAGTPRADGHLEVALPEAGARVLGVGVGSVIRSTDRQVEEPLDLEVVGVFERTDPADPWWDRDRLRGAGHLPGFPVSPGNATQVTDLVGPVVLEQNAFDASGVEVTAVITRWTADLSQVRPSDLAELGAATAAAREVVADEMAGTVSSVRYASTVQGVVDGAAGALVVTRSGVVVVGLLLVVVAIATLSQSARLLGEARKPEHELMRARGASRGHLVVAAGVESVVLGGVAAAVGTLAAARLHGRLVAPTSLGDTSILGLGPMPWLVAAATALLVAVVGVTPLLGPADTFVESEQATARPERRAALARAGLDIVLVVLAAVAYWQLRTYGTPVRGAGGTLTMDPVLVGGPVVVLVAATLLSLRVLPAVSHLVERLAVRGRGLVAPLAAWEVGRRPARAATAVLLLAVTVAVGTFTRSYLDTWSTSQDEQAAFAVGAPVVARPPGVVSAAPVLLGGPAADAHGAGVAQPVLRVEGRVATTPPADVSTRFRGRDVDVLAATAPARSLLTAGRVGAEGGDLVAALPAEDTDRTGGIELPADAVGFSGRLSVSARTVSMPNTAVAARLLLEDAEGLVTAVALPATLVDMTSEVDVLLDGVYPPGAGATATAQDWVTDPRRGPLRIVGMQVQVVGRDPGALRQHGPDARWVADVELRDLAILVPGTPEHSGPAVSKYPAVRAVVPDVPAGTFEPTAVRGNAASVSSTRSGGIDLRLQGAVEDLAVSPALGATTVWPALGEIPAVLSAPLAERLDASTGTTLHLRVDGVMVRLTVAGVVTRVPTMRSGEHLALDHTALSRTLALGGSTLPPADEWWVDVPRDQVDDYLAGLPTDSAGVPLAQSATSVVGTARDLREGPLRVALPLALWLVTAGAAVVAALGFGVHTTMTLRSRDVELAQLRAVGLQRRRLVAVVTLEALLVCVLGCLIGVGVGTLLAGSVAPLVSVAADGGAPVPSVQVHIPWDQVALVVVAVVVVVAGTAAGVARRQRTADPAEILRSMAGR